MKQMIMGIAGGTGSGKTMVAEAIANALGQRVAMLGLDSYYHDRKHLSVEERQRVNYDHPDAFDIALLLDHIERLTRGDAVDMPVYDYASHGRLDRTQRVEPAPVIIVEGIMVLALAQLRERLTVKIFVDTDADVRFIRRLARDIRERGRTPESVIEQYLSVVRPMHLEFVEPSKRYADIIVPEGGMNTVAIDFIVTKLRTLLH
ncbi:MAG: uridine kinase [Candidatus Sumerlaeaceae bacterium]|nr:uridine kinase [Candidatus Sumerlaeaceae bacterium]